MVYAGMLPCQFFASSITATSNSLIGNAQLITKDKVYIKVIKYCDKYFGNLMVHVVLNMQMPLIYLFSMIKNVWMIEIFR